MPERSAAAADRALRARRRHFIAGIAVAGAALVAGCSGGGAASGGGSSGSNSNASAATAVARVSSGLGAEASAVQSASGPTVKMTDQYKYDPSTITVPKGTTITWQNAGTMVHSATFDPAKAVNKDDCSLPAGVAPFDSGLLQPGQTWSHTFTVAGTYKYFCVPHEALGMKGQVIVQ
jgi:plastocyanin